jgi:hypothetical protein
VALRRADHQSKGSYQTGYKFRISELINSEWEDARVPEEEEEECSLKG